MLVCIPTNDDHGPDAELCDHFGSAPYFLLYDSETDRITVLSNENAHHSHGTCHPMTALTGYGIQAVVCRGMGRRAIEMMNAEGIRILRPTGRTVRETLSALKAGSLAEISPREACAGHGGRRLRAGEIDENIGIGSGRGSGCRYGHGGGQGSKGPGGRGTN